MPTSSSSDLELPDLPETPDTTGAYPRLTDDQIMLLSRYGERKSLTKGTKHPGEAYVLLGNAEQQLGNDDAAAAAYQKAATYPNTKKMAESWLHNMKIGSKPAAKKE